ncbi:MAG: hypothetical protein Q9162_004925 [Coniocarpon cinnabarinum]
MRSFRLAEARLDASVCLFCQLRRFQVKLSSPQVRRPYRTSIRHLQAASQAVAAPEFETEPGRHSARSAKQDTGHRPWEARQTLSDGGDPSLTPRARKWARMRPSLEASDSGIVSPEATSQPSQTEGFRQNAEQHPPSFRQAPVLDDPRLRPEWNSEPSQGSGVKSFARRGPRWSRDSRGSNTREPWRKTLASGRRWDVIDASNIEGEANAGRTEHLSSTPWGQHLRRRRVSYLEDGKRRPDRGESFRGLQADSSSSSRQNEISDNVEANKSHPIETPVNTSFHEFRPSTAKDPFFESDANFVALQGNQKQPQKRDLAGEATLPVDTEEANFSQANNSENVHSPTSTINIGRRAARFDAGEGVSGPPSRASAGSRRRPDKGNDVENFAGVGQMRSRRDQGRASRRSKKSKDVTSKPLDDDLIKTSGGMIDEDHAQARKQRRQAREEARRAKEERSRVAKSSTSVSLHVPPFISIQNLAALLKVRPEDFGHKLSELGFRNVSMDHVLNAENAALIAMEYDVEPILDQDSDADIKPRPAPIDKTTLPQRPPIVTIMGHVDHGKTTLLDYLRHSSVAANEHGGITQHIGAFSVALEGHENRLITFLDTPGHSAFLTMRQRGANVTDIVVLVVAADDSVKPQTIEAIKHSKAAGVQLVVAINKVDKDEADTQRVKQDLMREGIEVEDFGGDIQAVEVSGKTGQGVSNLEEAIITLADVLDVRAENDGPVEGWVLEAATKLAGRSATVLVRRGTLRPGDIIVAGRTWARARTLRNEAGIHVPLAGPGTPVEVDGWRDQPMAGQEVLQAPSEQKASAVIEYRHTREQRVRALSQVDAINDQRKLNDERRAKEREAVAEAEANLAMQENVTRRDKMEARKAAVSGVSEHLQTLKANDVPELFFVVKADVSGSAEAVTAAMNSLPLANQPIKLNVLRSAVGVLSESDIALAAAAPEGQGYVLSFNQEVPPSMSLLAAKSGVALLNASIIYKVIDDVREKVEDRLPPVVTSRVTGEAELLQSFDVKSDKKVITKVGGCRVTNGIVTRNSKARVYRGEVGRDDAIVFDGKCVGAISSGSANLLVGTMSSLKSHKRDVAEMRKGTECGLSFHGWSGFQTGDTIQCYEEKKERRRLL